MGGFFPKVARCCIEMFKCIFPVWFSNTSIHIHSAFIEHGIFFSPLSPSMSLADYNFWKKHTIVFVSECWWMPVFSIDISIVTILGVLGSWFWILYTFLTSNQCAMCLNPPTWSALILHIIVICCLLDRYLLAWGGGSHSVVTCLHWLWMLIYSPSWEWVSTYFSNGSYLLCSLVYDLWPLAIFLGI